MKRKTIFLTAALIALLAIGGVFGVLQKRQVSMKQPVMIDPVVETPVQNEPENVIDTSDWKTYRNDEYGFEFKYPKDWKVEKRSGVNFDLSIVSITSPETTDWIQKAISMGSNCEGCGADISFYYYSSIKNEPSNESIKANNIHELLDQDPLSREVGIAKIGDTEFIKSIQGGLGAYFVLFAQKNTALYKIFFTHADSEGALRPVDKVIIENFRIQE